MNRSRHIVLRLCALLLAAAAFAAPAGLLAQTTATAPASDAPVWVPPRHGDPRSREDFGDAKNIELFEGLAKDEDPKVRERAVHDLGGADNIMAMPLIKNAINDASPNVRGAAVAAAAELGMGDFLAVISAGLGDRNKDVVVLSCLCAVKRSHAAAKERLVELLDDETPAVRIAALEALTAMNFAAPAGKLKALLGAQSPTTVRLRAAANAALLAKGQGGEALAALADAARNDKVAAVRGIAVAALGRLDFDANAALIAEAWKDSGDLVRRGAVEAYIHAANVPPIKEFMADPSPMVRLAAIRLAGQRNLREAVPGLLEAFRDMPDNQAHDVAAASLSRIGGDDVTAAMGELAGETYRQAQAIHKEAPAARSEADKGNAAPGKLQAPGTQGQADQRALRLAKCIRNLRSCCRVLGELKSNQGLDVRSQILHDAVSAKPGDMVQIDSEILIEVVQSVGLAGEERGVEPVNALIAALAKQAPYVGADSAPPNFHYSTGVAVAAIAAAGDLRSSREMNSFDKIIDVRIKAAGRLNMECEAIMRVLPLLDSPPQRGAVETMTGKIIQQDSTYALFVQFEAVKDSGLLKLQKNLPAIRKLLDERLDRNTMRAAAWAIRELTGQMPAVGDPVVSEGSNWVIRKK